MAQRSTESTARKKHMRKWGWGCAGVLLLVAVLGGAAFFYLSRLWHSPPAGWRASQQATVRMTPRQRREAATSAENMVSAQLSTARSSQAVDSPRGSSPAEGDRSSVASSHHASAKHTLTLTTRQINAWLDQRLPLWASNQNVQIPPQLSDFRYWVEQGKPVFACRVHTNKLDQVVSVMFDPRITKKGKMKLAIASVRAGRLSLPTKRVVDMLTSYIHKQQPDNALAQDVVAVLKGKAFDPSLPTRGGREVKLVAIDAQPKQTTLTFRTESAGS